jgi:hypothetical protein
MAALGGSDDDVAGWGTWCSRRPAHCSATLPPAAAPSIMPRAQVDGCCQVQIIDLDTVSHSNKFVPLLRADVAVQADRSIHEQPQPQQPQQQPQHHFATLSTSYDCAQRNRSATDYIACAAVSCGGVGDFVPAPRCSVMRHAVLKADVQQPRHCSSVHYEQLLCVDALCALPATCSRVQPRDLAQAPLVHS